MIDTELFNNKGDPCTAGNKELDVSLKSKLLKEILNPPYSDSEIAAVEMEGQDQWGFIALLTSECVSSHHIHSSHVLSDCFFFHFCFLCFVC